MDRFWCPECEKPAEAGEHECLCSVCGNEKHWHKDSMGAEEFFCANCGPWIREGK